MSFKKYILLVVVVLALFTGAVLSQKSFEESRDTPSTALAESLPLAATAAEAIEKPTPRPITAITSSPSEPEPAAVPTPAPNVTVKIASTTYRVYAVEGASVLDAMNTLKSSGALTFSGKEFPGMGLFVDSIEGKKNADGYYWILYINGEPSDTGASQTTLNPGDTVEWRYEKGY